MIYRSQVPQVEIPQVSLPAFVLERMARWGDKPAIIDAATGRTVSYRRLAEQIRACAAGLAARGFGKGDVLAIYSHNVPEYPVAFFGAALAGGAVTTTNPLATAGELTKQLADAGARFLISAGPVLDKAWEAAADTGIQLLFDFDGGPGTVPFSSLLQSGSEPPDVAIDPVQDVVALPYSSGTTGLPKGVMLTHRNLVANLIQHESAPWHAGLGEQDVSIGALPFFHIYGMSVILGYGLTHGVTVVVLPRYDLESYLGAMATYGVTYAYTVPPIVLQLSKHPSVDGYDLSKVRTVFSAAAPLGEALELEVQQRLGCTTVQGYGMTEASPVTHLCPDAPGANKTGSVGLLAPATEMKIVDVVTGAPLPPGQSGELCMRGPQVMKGYLNQPDATRESLESEGWYHSGDIGYIDDDGFTYIVDRLKELIKYKGYQVAPAELEALLITHPQVVDAAVIPSPDVEAGEVPKAFVVPRDGAELPGPEQLMDWVAEQVAPYKRIRRLEFVDHIPKSPSGKILRRMLVEQERQRMAG